MCLQRYELDTKRNFWRRYDDIYPKVQIHFHFNSKSAIKNALELVLGPFTSNPKQVKKKILGGTGKFQDPPLEISRTRPVILCPLENSRPPPLENSRTQPVTRSRIFLSIHSSIGIFHNLVFNFVERICSDTIHCSHSFTEELFI